MSALFLDIGNVLLSNGWNRRMRQAAVEEKFNLDEEEMEDHHHLAF